jgi:hypothetical protein
MKTHYILFLSILICSYSCRIPIYLFTAKDGKFGENVIKNDSFSVYVNPITVVWNDANFIADETEWTLTNNDGYVIPVEIEINNYMNNTLNIKINDIKAYFRGNKNEVFDGVIDTSIDTIIINLQTKVRIPFIIKLNNLNRNNFNYYTDLNNYTLEILFPQINVNEYITHNKNTLFIGKMR